MLFSETILGRERIRVAPEMLEPADVTSAARRMTMSTTTVFRADTIDVLRRQLGDAGGVVVAELIGLYLVQGHELVAEIEAAGATPDPVMLRAAAHKLKGSTATLGGDRLAAVCQRIEAAPPTELDVDGASREARREFELLSAELTHYRASLAGTSGSTEAG
jgi:HPt (histidine-containing phosphotransfer) domain-containing protein